MVWSFSSSVKTGRDILERTKQMARKNWNYLWDISDLDLDDEDMVQGEFSTSDSRCPLLIDYQEEGTHAH